MARTPIDEINGFVRAMPALPTGFPPVLPILRQAPLSPIFPILRSRFNIEGDNSEATPTTEKQSEEHLGSASETKSNTIEPESNEVGKQEASSTTTEQATSTTTEATSTTTTVSSTTEAVSSTTPSSSSMQPIVVEEMSDDDSISVDAKKA